ncbi:MAG: LysM peptidoglycan-binding domain-containing protein [Myxococcaceae bacterium]|nr:LysM peptidoglycan-binding domain-containing protein [Myxococcaceae bacterium]MCA3011447.1 LysM peptidoglycan-binding domain-containing protein [Myxococcaceae bacterium]
MPTRVSTPAPRTQTQPTQPPSSGGASIDVKPGDSLSKLARRHGVTMDALVQANVGRYPGLATNRNALAVGWVLTLPARTPAGDTTPAGPQGWSGQQSSRPSSATTTQQAPEPQRVRGEGARLAAGGVQSLERQMRAHHDALERTGVGLYYGDKSGFAKLDRAGQRQWLQDNVKPDQTPPTGLKESSCIGWALEHVGAAYAAAGKADRWREIYATVTRNGAKGTDLAKELQKDGWKAIYWNPDAKKPADGDSEHSFSAAQVRRGNGYYGIKVDDSVVNFRPTEGGGTAQDMSGIERLKEVPFWFGLARGGKHTFVGRGNQLNEFHWTEQPTSSRPFSEKPLETYSWLSGLIMVPPGTWPTGDVSAR